ncbi:MAG: sn-glycerol-3-phosphate ABC transporter ATP-binding protein UgpC [Actinobacteria bacterium]|nr:sn-glycerol-3-phosphate ABC transporter ATP-binding protein UgpC [Actinomycetota bacterium]
MGRLVLDKVRKQYGDGVVAVKGLDIDVADGEFLVLLGPSGCGKTTALRMVAGLEEITDGTIELDGRVLNDVEPRARDVAMVFQNYALYPHMSVRANIGFPLKQRKLGKAEREERIGAVAETLGLVEQLDKKPGQLSGGQRQRVAMGRAIVREPSLFLMDEPLSNLDAKLRVQMRIEIHAVQRRFGTTTLYVTHDQVEAMTLGDRVAVMREGVLQQIATPGEAYGAPANVFVATFLGNPGMNLFDGELEVDGDAVAVRIGEARVPLDEAELRSQPAVRARGGGAVVVGVRPECLVVPNGIATDRGLGAKVELTEDLGSNVLAYFSIPGMHRTPVAPAAVDGKSPAAAGARDAWALGRFGRNIRFDSASSVRLALEPGAMRFFDPDSGTAI